jgi:diaminopimelate epimerase
MPAMIAGEFHKMHGLGNDFVIIDCRNAPLVINPEKARNIADRGAGIGCDQLILIEPSDVCDIRMRIFNHDGSEVEACGNATRCVVALLDRDISIETKGGLLMGTLTGGGVSVDIGEPRFQWKQIPLAYAMDTEALPLAWEELSSPICVNVGNPHAVFFVPDVDSIALMELGPIIEHDIVFPERVNVNVASVKDNKITLRVWERGVGLTRACGTGACATAVAAIRRGLVQSPVKVEQLGGQLTVAWQPGQSILMTGGTSYVFKGIADWDQF